MAGNKLPNIDDNLFGTRKAGAAYNYLADDLVAGGLRSGTTFKPAWARSRWGSEAGAFFLFFVK